MTRRRLLPAFALAGAAILAAGCSRRPGPADTIYFGGPILTMVGEAPAYVEAVAVEDGRIVFTGTKAEALELAGPATSLRDLRGTAMLPGFIDAHSHFMFALNMVNQVNVAGPPVGPCTDIPSVIAALKAYRAAARIPEGGWIIGWGYDPEQLAERRHITKRDLDPHFPGHKVMLIHVSSHGAVLNSKALEWAGIDENTKTPPGGVINRLPGSNEPAGLLMETAYLPVMARLPQPSEAQRLELVRGAQMTYAREGYTHAQEGFTHLKDFRFLRKAADEDRFFLDIAALAAFTEVPQWLNHPDYAFGRYYKRLKLQGVKFVQDGSPQGRTAYVTSPYLTGGPGGEKDWRGEPTLPREQFLEQVQAVLDAGLQVFVHANGDAAIDQVIEAVENAGITAADDRRTVVIHSQFQRPDHLPAYARLGLTPSYFTNHCFFWGDVHINNIGMEKAAFISPIKAARQAGLVYSNHSDFTVTPLDPMFILWTAMARETRSGTVLGPEQRVDAYTALQGLTAGPAWQLFEEDRKGAIREGLLADFVILSRDPIETPVDEIRSIEVLETIKEDRTVFRAE